MAVFTHVTFAQAQAWLARFPIGPLVELEGIASGIENSNFFVTTAAADGRPAGRFVLTLFERLSAEQLPFYLGMMHALAQHDIPCPDPVAADDGRLLGELEDKPAALVTRLAGRSNMAPTPDHCAAVGETLARMHRAALDYDGAQPNLRGLAWWEQTAPRVVPFLDDGQRELLREAMAEQLALAAAPIAARLPRTAVHADLFRDNVLFEGTTLTGVIDFYFAGVDTWIFDLAVTCNDWCIDDASGAFDMARLDALLRAYRSVREPDAAEQRCWPAALRAAALRFWLSRLFDQHLPRPAQMVTPKDPGHCERVLRARQGDQPPLAGG
ncbi:MAG: homoserine kinase [Burkholderiaceae bacterium]